MCGICPKREFTTLKIIQQSTVDAKCHIAPSVEGSAKELTRRANDLILNFHDLKNLTEKIFTRSKGEQVDVMSMD